MKLYNTQTKKIEEIKPQDGTIVKMYVCGPTVYNFPHLGNYRTYLNADFLHRALIFLGYRVKEVMNVTDIDDKIIRDSKIQKVSPSDLAKKYEKIFFDDIKSLNILEANAYPRATDPAVIEEMIKIIKKLIENKQAYVTDDGVYFSINSFPGYGKLSGVDLTAIKKCERVSADEYEKEYPGDFALWKFKKEGEPSWPAPFGEGRPGWHIECTAMNLIELGETIDIHAGAVDLIFPHHENEIAQTESYTKKPFVKYWFHPEHLLIKGERMGKSLGNFFVLSDLREKFGVHPLAFRILAASCHYRERLNLTRESLIAADLTLNNLYSDVLRIKAATQKGNSRITKEVETARVNFKKAVSEDLAVPRALATLFLLLNKVNKITGRIFRISEKKELIEFLSGADEVLGFGLSGVRVEEIPEDVISLVKIREQKRKDGDFEKSDDLRGEIEKRGYQVEDTKEGPLVRKIS